MNLKEKLARGDFVITAEMAPPKGIDFGHIRECARAVKGRVDGVNVTDFQSAVVRASSWEEQKCCWMRAWNRLCRLPAGTETA